MHAWDLLRCCLSNHTACLLLMRWCHAGGCLMHMAVKGCSLAVSLVGMHVQKRDQWCNVLHLSCCRAGAVCYGKLCEGPFQGAACPLCRTLLVEEIQTEPEAEAEAAAASEEPASEAAAQQPDEADASPAPALGE